MEVFETQYRVSARHRNSTWEEERISDHLSFIIWYYRDNEFNCANGDFDFDHRNTRKPNRDRRPNSAICGDGLVQ